MEALPIIFVITQTVHAQTLISTLKTTNEKRADK